MSGLAAAFIVSFGTIFVAELGDKSQLMALAERAGGHSVVVAASTAFVLAELNRFIRPLSPLVVSDEVAS